MFGLGKERSKPKEEKSTTVKKKSIFDEIEESNDVKLSEKEKDKAKKEVDEYLK